MSRALAVAAALLFLSLFAGEAEGDSGLRPKTSTVELRGRHVILTLPASARDEGPRLLELGDATVEYYSQLFGLPLDERPFYVFFYAKDAEFRRAVAEIARRPVPYAGGISFYPGGAHLPWRSWRGAPTDGAGETELTYAHELAHYFQKQRFPLYQHQPTWLVEGLADLMAEHAVARDHRFAHESTPFIAGRFLAVRDAIAHASYIPLADLVGKEREATRSDVVDERRLVYAESFCLLHMLSETKPDAFRRFVRAAVTTKGFFIPERINARLVEELAPERSLQRLDEALRRYVVETDVLPWQPLRGDMRVSSDGVAQLRCSSGGAVAIHSAVVDEGQTVALTVDFKGDDLLLPFRFRGARDYLFLSLGADGTVIRKQPTSSGVTLHRVDGVGEAKVLWGERGLPPLAWGPHRISLSLAPKKIQLDVDGVHWIDVPVDEQVRGRFGVGTDCGSIAFHDLTIDATPAAPPPAPPPHVPSLPPKGDTQTIDLPLDEEHR